MDTRYPQQKPMHSGFLSHKSRPQSNIIPNPAYQPQPPLPQQYHARPPSQLTHQQYRPHPSQSPGYYVGPQHYHQTQSSYGGHGPIGLAAESTAGVADAVGRVAHQLDIQVAGPHMHFPMHMPMHMPMGLAAHGSMSHHGLAHHPPPPPGSVVSVAPHPPMGMPMMGMRPNRKSIPTICPRCRSQIMTAVERRPNALNFAASAGAVVLGFILKLPKNLLPMAFLPLQMRALHSVRHHCPRCNYKLGKNIKVSIPRTQ